MKTLIIIIGLAVLTSFRPVELTRIEATEFCEGWEDGYKDALESCLRINLTPLCPIPPVGRNTYKHGYGMGYAKGEQLCDTDKKLNMEWLTKLQLLVDLN